MQSVSSNAVASALGGYAKLKMSGNSFTDANDLPDGFYCCYGLTNAPNGNWFAYLTLTFDDNIVYRIQVAFQLGYSFMYIRNRQGGWSEWRAL